jgi:hypothetical protein
MLETGDSGALVFHSTTTLETLEDLRYRQQLDYQ